MIHKQQREREIMVNYVQDKQMNYESLVAAQVLNYIMLCTVKNVQIT